MPPKDSFDGAGQRLRKCSKCGNYFTLADSGSRICPDCDPALAPGNPVREVILEGGVGARISRGFDLLAPGEDDVPDRKPPQDTGPDY